MLPSFALSALASSKMGGVCIPYTLNFGSIGTISIDLTEELMNDAIDQIQSIYVDNSNNNNPMTMKFSGTQLVIQVAANRQGVYPSFAARGRFSITFVTTVAGGLLVPVGFLNQTLPYAVWST